MKLFFSLFSLLLLLGCSEDCSKCEQLLLDCMTSEPIPVDLPEPEHHSNYGEDPSVTVNVTAEDEYMLNDTIYPYEELEPKLLLATENGEGPRHKLKIAGDKMAHYEAVFRLIAFSKENEISPILVFE